MRFAASTCPARRNRDQHYAFVKQRMVAVSLRETRCRRRKFISTTCGLATVRLLRDCRASARDHFDAATLCSRGRNELREQRIQAARALAPIEKLTANLGPGLYLRTLRTPSYCDD